MMRTVAFFALLSAIPLFLTITGIDKIRERRARRNAPQFSVLDLLLLPLCLLPSMGAAVVAAQHNAGWSGWLLAGFSFLYQLSFAFAFWSTFSWGMGTSGPNNFLAALIGASVGWIAGLLAFAVAAMITGL